jgi:hypothetical protein
MQYRDLKLDYVAAAHGVQSAVRFEMSMKGMDDDVNPALNMLKHLRTGLDMRAADAGGLAGLLIKKGVFTEDEYLEAMRLAANEELARYTEHCNTTYKVNVTFR